MKSALFAPLLLLALVAVTSGESDFCKAERLKCEKRCNGLKMDFDCNDQPPGARSVACACGGAENAAQEAAAKASSGSTHSTSFGSSAAASSSVSVSAKLL